MNPILDLVEMTVADVEAGFANGAFTSESLTKAFLDRIAVYNPSYTPSRRGSENAFAFRRLLDLL